MYRYKFNGHFRGIGQDEYLSQGKYNYASNIDMNLHNIYFKLGNLPVIHGKCPEKIRKIVTLGNSQYALGTSLSRVWYLGNSITPTTGFNLFTDSPTLDYVYTSAGMIDIIPMNQSGTRVYYLFEPTQIRQIDATDVSGNTDWTTNVTTTFTGLFAVQDVFVTYLSSRLYFAQWDGGNQFKLSKIDEFGVKTDNVFGSRYFDSKIVGLTITGSVLNIYLQNGEKSLMDLSSETIIETAHLNKTIKAVVGYSNLDYVLCEGDFALSLCVSAGYEIKEVVKTSLNSSLGAYNEFGGSNSSEYKNNPKNSIHTFKIYKGSVYFSDDRQLAGDYISKMKPDFTVQPLLGTDIEGDVITTIYALEVYSNRVYFGYRKTGSSDTFFASLPLNESNYYQSKGYLAENVFTGGDITQRKELAEVRLRAEIPTGTRVILKAVCDGIVSDEVIELSPSSKKVHVVSCRWSGFEIMPIYEVYNDNTPELGHDTPEIYEMEIAYNFIEN